MEKAEDKEKAAREWVKETIQKHKRIIFNGNGYSKEWEKEAEKRGLANLRSTPEAIAALDRKENRDLLVSSRIFTEAEIDSREAIKYQDYHSKAVIEAKTMSRMVHKLYLPAIHKALREIVQLDGFYKDEFMVVSEEKTALEKVLNDTYSSLKRLDSFIKEDARKIAVIREQLEKTDSNGISVEKIAENTGLSKQDIIIAMEAENPTTNIENESVIDFIEHKNAHEISVSDRVVDNLTLQEAIKKLSEEEKRFIRIRYLEEKTQSQTAQILGKNQVAVSRYEKKLLLKLRRSCMI